MPKQDAGAGGRVWWVHTSTWDTDGATHTYAQLRCGPTRVRIAHRLTEDEARSLDPRDPSAAWEVGETTIRFAVASEARAAAIAAWHLLAGSNDVLCGDPPEQPQVPLAAPARLLAAAQRLQGTLEERAAAWRWLLLGTGYDTANAASDAPDELVMAKAVKGWSLTGTARSPRPPKRPRPEARHLGDVVLWPRVPPRHDGD